MKHGLLMLMAVAAGCAPEPVLIEVSEEACVQDLLSSEAVKQCVLAGKGFYFSQVGCEFKGCSDSVITRANP